MTSARPTGNAWGLTPRDVAGPRDDGSPVIADFLAFVALPFRVETPGVGLPFSDLAMGCYVLYCLSRRPADFARKRPIWFPALVLALLAAYVASALVNSEMDARRLAHLGLWVALALVLSSGRGDAPSAARGFCVGLVVSAGLSTAMTGIGGGNGIGYEGRFAGLLGDPNAQGMTIVGVGLASAGFIRTQRVRLAFLAFCVFGVAVTLSRTSLLALVIAFFWVAVASLVRPPIAGTLTLAFWMVVETYAEGLKHSGVFKERAGSDALRQRIEALELTAVSRHPWWGNGPGTAQVTFENGNTFFYHSSYLALRAEVGWLGLGIWVLLFGLVFLTLLPLPQSPRHRWLAAGLVGLAISAINLGEVITTTTTAALLGFTIWLVSEHRHAVTTSATSREEAMA